MKDEDEGKQQQFTFRLIGGRYQIFTFDRKVVEVPESTDEDDAELKARENDNEDNEMWTLLPAGDECYFIESFCGKRMDAKNGIPLNNNRIAQREPND